MPKAGWYTRWRPPIVNDCYVLWLVIVLYVSCFQSLAPLYLEFRKFLNKTFIHFVHCCRLFCVARCLTPWPLVHLHRRVHLRRVGECVGLTSVNLGKVLLCHTLRSVAPTPVGECVGLTSVNPGKVLLCHTLWSVVPTPSPS